MVEGGGSYRQKLVSRMAKKKGFSTPPPKAAKTGRTSLGPPSPTSLAYSKGFEYLGDFIKDIQLGGLPSLGEDLGSGDYGSAALAVGSAGLGAAPGGRGAGLLGKLSTPVLQRATRAAAEEGKYVGADIFEKGLTQGVRYPMQGIDRAARGGEDALFEFISDLERIGVKPQTANRLLRGFSKYYGDDGPLGAMVEIGGDLERGVGDVPFDFKHALIMRMIRRIQEGSEGRFYA